MTDEEETPLKLYVWEGVPFGGIMLALAQSADKAREMIVGAAGMDIEKYRAFKQEIAHIEQERQKTVMKEGLNDAEYHAINDPLEQAGRLPLPESKILDELLQGSDGRRTIIRYLQSPPEEITTPEGYIVYGGF